MKLFVKIIAGILAGLLIIIIALNLYFTDERLKDLILPQIRAASGSEVQVERMSVTFFRTFPRFGLEMEGVNVPDPHGVTAASADEILVTVELFPLFKNEISITRLSLAGAQLFYTVYADSTTNIDFLTEAAADEPAAEDSGFDLSIPQFTLRSAGIFYRDETSGMRMEMHELDADISLRFAELLESRVDARLGSLYLFADDTEYISGLSLSLNKTSSIDLENERLTLTEGTFSIRGLALNLAGSVSGWSGEGPLFSIQFSSTSDNFGELLRLAPPQFDEALAGLVTRGSLLFEGSVEGRFGQETLPRFDVVLDVTNGFLQNPDLPEAVEDIRLSLILNNDLATIREFRARAGVNSITATGTLERPLDEDGVFSLELDGDMDLATLSSFYPIGELGLEQLAGLMKADARATGRMDRLEDATFSGFFALENGLVKYEGVPNAIEQVNARAEASQERIRILESGFTAASNRFLLSGSILRPLDEEQRTIDLTATMNFDLATIKEFYPIDEDTLSMRGQLTAEVVLRGKPDPDQIESLVQRGNVELRNGYLSHRLTASPLEDVTFEARANGALLTVSRARFRSGENSLAMQGTITRYLSDDPLFDLTLDGEAVFSDLAAYYSLEPWIQELAGNAVMNVNAKGPAGDPLRIALNGEMTVNNVSALGDSLFLPVTNLAGQMRVTPDAMTLERFFMNYGRSDIQLQGSMRNYLGFLEEHHASPASMPAITGSYSSRFLDLDEMIDWDEEDVDAPIPIQIPRLTAAVEAAIDSLRIFNVPVTHITGSGNITPQKIVIDRSEARLFDGTATGKMEWNVPDPLRTNILFTGELNGLKAETFFRDTGFLGKNSTIHQYISGEFSSEIRYATQFDAALNPDIGTTDARGTFGMTRARMRGHPIQAKVAEFLGVPELETLALDAWTANFSIKDTVMTLQNFQLTSENLGLLLEGTLHMTTDRINYTATLLLPERFKRGIASVISGPAADALQLEDGRIAVPIRITGTTASPQVRPDTEVIERIVRERVREGAGDLLRRLFRGN